MIHVGTPDFGFRVISQICNGSLGLPTSGGRELKPFCVDSEEVYRVSLDTPESKVVHRRWELGGLEPALL